MTASFLRPLNRVRKNLKWEKNMGSLSSCWKEPQTGSIRFCRKGCISAIRIGTCFPARLRLRGVSQKSLCVFEFQETVSPKTPIRERRRTDRRVSSVNPTTVGQGPVNPSKSASFLLSDIWKLATQGYSRVSTWRTALFSVVLTFKHTGRHVSDYWQQQPIL